MEIFAFQLVTGVGEDIQALGALAPDIQSHLVLPPGWSTPSSSALVGLRSRLLLIQTCYIVSKSLLVSLMYLSQQPSTRVLILL